MDDYIYFPLKKGVVLQYRSEVASGEVHLSTWEITKMWRHWPEIGATVTIAVQGSEPETYEDYIFRDETGLYYGRGGQLILPLPLKIGATWREGINECRIISFSETTETVGGRFNECLYIEYLIAGGDAGYGKRYYAPGIGLVREDHSAEDESWIRELSKHNVPYDLFISHASEDKDQVARPLAKLLAQRGMRVWFDEFTLKIGMSLNQAINRGLADSRYGIVILSPDFIRKHWTQQELNGLTAIESVQGKKILPIWHNVSQKQIAEYSPILADRFAGRTDQGIETLAEEIIDAIRSGEY